MSSPANWVDATQQQQQRVCRQNQRECLSRRQWWTFGMFMMTSSNGNIFRVTGLLCGEFTGPGEFPTQRPVTRSFDVFFDLHLNKRLSKQPWGWWLGTLSWSLWRHRNALRAGSGSWCEYRRSCLVPAPQITLPSTLTYHTSGTGSG